MAVVNIHKEASDLLEKIKNQTGIEKKWLATKCILDHAESYSRK